MEPSRSGAADACRVVSRPRGVPAARGLSGPGARKTARQGPVGGMIEARTGGAMDRLIKIYDTTLRDGTQGEGVAFSMEDKVRIAHRLDALGIHYIEGGWPGSNPKDLRFFKRVQDAVFKTAKITAFGATRRPGVRPQDDGNLQALVEAGP